MNKILTFCRTFITWLEYIGYPSILVTLLFQVFTMCAAFETQNIV